MIFLLAGEIVDVTGTFKGKGFQGVIKDITITWTNDHGSHIIEVLVLWDNRPMTLLKGKKLPGHMGT